MDLPISLAKVLPRESSGSSASKGFNYQKNWAICLMLKLHCNESDYAVLFDFHEDIVAVTKFAEKHSLDFYQVKTISSGNYSANDFFKTGKTKELNNKKTVVGKLAANYINFKEESRSLNLVTNACFSSKICSDVDSTEKKPANTFKPEFVESLKKKLHAELGVGEIDNILEILFIKRSSLSLDDQRSHTLGRVTDFLRLKCPQGKGKPYLFYDTLFNVASEKNAKKVAINSALSINDILDLKAISRCDILKLIESYDNYIHPSKIIEEIIKDAAESYSERININKNARMYNVDIMDPENEPVKELSAFLRYRIDELSLMNFESIIHYANSVVTSIPLDLRAKIPKEENYLYAAALYEIKRYEWSV